MDETSSQVGRTVGRVTVLAQRLNQLCLQKGWDKKRLAKAAGLSRTTLYHLERGSTRHPRRSTLQRLASALEVEVEELLAPPAGGEFRQRIRSSCRTFNRNTNTAVATVCEENPELFSGWSAEEWDELYSTFGTGGRLTPGGVIDATTRINSKRETLQQLQILLDTHLRSVVVKLVDTLYQMVCPEDSRTAPSELSEQLVPPERTESDPANSVFGNVQF